ncbi:MAG: hypothetical protein ABI682_15090 [Acidobacteriota bacterium]
MPEDRSSDSPDSPTRPAPRRRSPRRKPAASTPDREAAATPRELEAVKTALSPGVPESSRATAGGRSVEEPSRPDPRSEQNDRVFDELVDYGSPARDLNRLASRNPGRALLGALAVGFVVGFGVGVLVARD